MTNIRRTMDQWGFKRVTKRGGERMTASISGKKINIGKSSWVAVGNDLVGKPKYFVLGYNEEQKVIGLFNATKDDINPYKISNASVSVIKLCSQFGLDYESLRGRYEMNFLRTRAGEIIGLSVDLKRKKEKVVRTMHGERYELVDK